MLSLRLQGWRGWPGGAAAIARRAGPGAARSRPTADAAAAAAAAAAAPATAVPAAAVPAAATTAAVPAAATTAAVPAAAVPAAATTAVTGAFQAGKEAGQPALLHFQLVLTHLLVPV